MQRLLVLILICVSGIRAANAQSCGTRQLDPKIASFLQLIQYKDLSLDELRRLPIEQIKFAGPPLVPYPKEDVTRIKITADSIPVLVFNPSHATGLPILINYHGGGFISPLIPGLEHSLWQDAKTFNAIVFAVDYRVARNISIPLRLMIATMHLNG